MRKILGSKKGISTILAALLMVVIVVVASVMVYAWSTGLLGGLMGGRPNVNEALTMDSFSRVNATAYRLFIRNAGTVDTTLSQYFIEEGGQALTNGGITTTNVPSGTTLPVSSTSVAVTFSYSGFTAGHQYVIKIITTRNTQFTFNIVAS